MPLSKLIQIGLVLTTVAAPCRSMAEDATGHAMAARPHHVYLVGTLRVMRPWINADSDTPDLGDGYVVIENRSDAPDRLVSVTIDVADSVTLSPSDSETDVAETGLTVPPRGRLTLKPDDMHLVLHGLHRDVRKGDRIPGVIRFERAGPVKVEFTTDRDDAVNDDQTEPSTDGGATLVK